MCYLETNVALFSMIMVLVSCIGKSYLGDEVGQWSCNPAMFSLEIIYSWATVIAKSIDVFGKSYGNDCDSL